MYMKNKILIMFVLAVIVAPCISLADTQSIVALQQELHGLLSQLSKLQAQLVAQQADIPCYFFKKNLSIGQSGADVTNLQTVLQKDGESLNVSEIFDKQTASAVSAFQEKYMKDILKPVGLSAGTGYVGARTISKLNTLFGCGTVNVTSTQITASTTVSPVVSITESDTGKTITLAKDQKFTVTLSNPGDGGYSFDDPQYDASLLRLDSHVHNNPASTSSTVQVSGNFGTDVWQFSPLKPGISDLIITATRPWSGGGTVTMLEVSVVIP